MPVLKAFFYQTIELYQPIASLKALPGLNLGALEAAIFMVAPV